MISRMGMLLSLCGCLAAVGLGTGLLSGCSKEDEQPEHRIIEGRVSEINQETGEVGMLWYNKKKGKEIPLRGKLAQGAEILINGRTANLDDVLIDDQVQVVGSVVGEGESQRLIAHKVTITRAQEDDAEDQADEPATEPAEETGEPAQQ